jgi:hypothetical protein
MNSRNYFLFLLISLFLAANSYSQQLAFPTAEGYGKNTTGGRGGKLYIVSNLNDAGAGSFREAVEASGKRTVVFAVSGLILLQSQLTIKNGDISILGQSAPGDGICIGNYTVQLSASNVIIRYMRFRPGSLQNTEYDASWGRNNKNIIFDHCSFSWGNDEQASFYDNENFTMQYCIISESFYSSSHPKGNHGYGGIWGGWGATFHHNLIANHTSRMPRFCGARYHLDTYQKEIVDFRNNVIFNWGFNNAYGGEAGNHNMVNNYFKPGPATSTGSVKYRIINPSDTKADGNPISKWYISGNYMAGNTAVTADNWNGGVQQSDATITASELKLNSPLPSAGISTQTAQDAYTTVLASAGANLKRDAVDLRAINGTSTGVTNYGGIYGANKGIIDNEGQVGGFPTYSTYNQITDTDKDGMDDAWEKTHGMLVGTKDDAGDIDSDGYTNLEEYLSCLTGEGSGCDVKVDCNGVIGGTASLDNCSKCVGGNTGKIACVQDCQGVWGGTKVSDNCGVCLVNANVKPCSGSLEAELTCSVSGLVLENKNAGFKGDSYVNADNAVGVSVAWVLQSTSAQTATISFRYANGGTTSRDGQIIVNGKVISTLLLPPTGAWTTWNTASINVLLQSGFNNLTIKSVTADGLANIDQVIYSAGVSDGNCIVTSIDTENLESVSIYPNPTKDFIHVSKEVEWKVLSNQGELLIKGNGNEISLMDLISGSYLLNVNGVVYKIIKQ